MMAQNCVIHSAKVLCLKKPKSYMPNLISTVFYNVTCRK